MHIIESYLFVFQAIILIINYSVYILRTKIVDTPHLQDRLYYRFIMLLFFFSIYKVHFNLFRIYIYNVSITLHIFSLKINVGRFALK